MRILKMYNDENFPKGCLIAYNCSLFQHFLSRGCCKGYYLFLMIARELMKILTEILKATPIYFIVSYFSFIVQTK